VKFVWDCVGFTLPKVYNKQEAVSVSVGENRLCEF
jgi:hypothetical protein